MYENFIFVRKNCNFSVKHRNNGLSESGQWPDSQRSGMSFEDEIDALDRPTKNGWPPDSHLSRYLEQHSFYGKRFIRWRGFSSKKERKAWHELELLYTDKTIIQKIDWATQNVAPGKVIQAITTALTKHVKPDRLQKGKLPQEAEEFEP
jgi:hypothetical protein